MYILKKKKKKKLELYTYGVFTSKCMLIPWTTYDKACMDLSQTIRKMTPLPSLANMKPQLVPACSDAEEEMVREEEKPESSKVFSTQLSLSEKRKRLEEEGPKRTGQTLQVTGR